MGKQKTENALTEHLQYTFGLVTNWLIFAESKNAAIIAANTALLVGYFTILSFNLAFSPEWFRHYFTVHLNLGVFLSFASIGLALFSFSPSLKMPDDHSSEIEHTPRNLLYFNDIARMDTHSFISSVIQEYFAKKIEPNKAHYDLASQIVNTSSIAVRKYSLFSLSLWLLISAVVNPLFAIILFYSSRRRK